MAVGKIQSASAASISGNIAFGMVMFYSTQIRELSRFYQQKAKDNKEQQVSHVLNSQSDSIVVIQAVKGDDPAGNEEEAEQRVLDSLKV